MDACRDALIETDIWLCQHPVPVEHPNYLRAGKQTDACRVRAVANSLAMVPLLTADPQAMGSAITYARRYAHRHAVHGYEG